MSVPVTEPERRPVLGFPGYAVSADGRPWSRWKRGPGGLGDVWKELAGSRDKDGYRKVILVRDGVRHYFRVHHLVLLAFVGPCPPGMEGRHKNNLRDDNRADNLLWSTHVDNVADKKAHGTHQRGSKNGMAAIDEVKAKRIKRRLARGASPTAVARTEGVAKSIVNNIKYHGTWKHVEV